MSPGIFVLRPRGVQAERINGDSDVRLTLRTLLAYLDDILPPAETKEMGERIAASPVAAQLVDRIRDVMRRRRLTAPEVDGSGGGIEPNLVAEYLDNSLPPEKVADVERVCLESDVNLAEVAACHQILTLVLGEPVEIAGRLRERMYALGPQGTPLDVPEPPLPSKNVRETNAREQMAAIRDAQRPKPIPVKPAFESRVPEYLRTKPLWQRALPWMIVPLLLLGYFGLLWKDPTLFGGGKKGVAPDEGRIASGEKAPPNVAEPKKEGDAAAAGGAAAVASNDRPLPELPVDPEPPADQATGTAVTATGETTTAKSTEAGAAVAAASGATTPADTGAVPMPNEAPATAAPAEIGPPKLDLVSTDGIVLRGDPRLGQWFPLGADEDPPAGAPIAVPDPFRAELAFAALPLRVTALGGTRFTPLGPGDAAPGGFDIAEGRLRVAADSAVKSADQMMFALRLGPGLWRVEPLTPDTVLGLEAVPLQPTAVGQDLRGRTPQGVVYVAAGTVRVADSSGHVEVVSAGNRMVLTPAAGGDAAGLPPAETAAAAATENTAAAVPAPAESSAPGGDGTATAGTAADPETTTVPETEAPVTAAPAVGLPDWITPREPTASAKRAMAAFKAEFVPGAPAGDSLLPAVKNRLFYVAEPAAKGLGLIEDVDGLVKTLRDTEHPEAVIAATDGLRNWLGRSPDRGEVLRRELEEAFRPDLAQTLLRLLWGFGPDDAKDEATAVQLVEWLADNDTIVRELAFYHVRRLSGGRTLTYNPEGTQSQRAGAVNQWRAFVKRHGGLVVK